MSEQLVQDLREQISAKQERLATLEREAGIEAAMQAARSGSLFPLGIDGSDVSPAEYCANEHDHARRRTRKVYFGVADRATRVTLMQAIVELEQLADREMAAESARIGGEVRRAEDALNAPSYGMAAAVAAAMVAIGYASWQLPGAMAGMVAGFFLAQGTLARERALARNALRAAQGDHKAAEADAARLAAYPPMFGPNELASGERDPAMDGVSAYRAVVASQTNGSGQ